LVKEVKDDVVVLDANHPLAGETLIFELEVLDIQ
jgi:FKBP-type peptidyl-prolyl cis-trans isomerase 2